MHMVEVVDKMRMWRCLFMVRLWVMIRVGLLGRLGIALQSGLEFVLV